jgi:hypothetical protein
MGYSAIWTIYSTVLVASPDPKSQRHRFQKLLARLREYGLLLNAKKCIFGQSAVEFQGHSVSGYCASPLEDKTAAICAFPQPTTVKELQGFLGTVNFYR